jgi:hypothetical protein
MADLVTFLDKENLVDPSAKIAEFGIEKVFQASDFNQLKNSINEAIQDNIDTVAYATQIDTDRQAVETELDNRLFAQENAAWVNISSLCTFTGWSSLTTAIVNAYILNEKVCFLQFEISGTANTSAKTITLPATYQSKIKTDELCRYSTGSNGSIGFLLIPLNSSIITFSVSAGTPPTSGTVNFSGTLTYKIN